MILLVDLGNTRLKWALCEKRNKIDASAAEVYAEADIEALLTARWGAMQRPDRVVVASVATAACEKIAAWTQRVWALAPERVNAERRRFGVTNAYSEPQRLGVDRWLALVAARSKANGPVCVVDCGTAITIDIMDGEGKHLGGLIVPGLQMMRASLLKGTSCIAAAAAEGSNGDIALLARNTCDAVNAGTLYAAIAVIDRITADLAQELNEPLTRFICGGDAPCLLPLLAGEYRHEPDLVLFGLSVVAHP